MLKIKVDKNSKAPDEIMACGMLQDILLELSMVISSISQQLMQPALSDLKEYEHMMVIINASVAAGVQHGLHAAMEDRAKKTANDD